MGNWRIDGRWVISVECRSMKLVTQLLGIGSLLCLNMTASAAVLTLVDWTTIPVPSGAHADRYTLPNNLIGTEANPVTTVEIFYHNDPLLIGSGIHEIQSANFLFQPSDVMSLTVIECTAEIYWARVVFNPSRNMTGLSNGNDPAFVAMHSNGINSSTAADWTVTYLNGSTQSSNNGIVPEPCGAALLSVSLIFVTFRRKIDRRQSVV